MKKKPTTIGSKSKDQVPVKKETTKRPAQQTSKSRELPGISKKAAKIDTKQVLKIDLQKVPKDNKSTPKVENKAVYKIGSGKAIPKVENKVVFKIAGKTGNKK